jgi:hypothetical protein
LAATECGEVRSSAGSDFHTDFHMGSRDASGASRNWSGLRRTQPMSDRFNFNPQEFLDSSARFGLALAGKERPNGFDLISRGGIVSLIVEP